MKFVDRVCKDLKFIIDVCIEVFKRLFWIYCVVLDGSMFYLRNVEDELKVGKMKFCEFNDFGIFKNGDMKFEKNFLESCKDIK